MTITAAEAYEAMRAHHKALSEGLTGRADAVSGPDLDVRDLPASSPGIAWRRVPGPGGSGSAAPAPSRKDRKGDTMHGEFKPPSGWRDHDWRFIRDEPQDPALHMALDEVLAREVAAGRRPPTLRIWEWSAPAVVIGSFQSLRNEVDTAEARRHGFTVVRRISGGGAMFVEPASTITYSLYAPESLVAGMPYAESYRYLDDWVIGALTEDLGIAAWYQPLNDITSAQGKIGGAAQKRLAGGTVLHHVTMAYDIDADAMIRVLRTGREKLSDKAIPSAAKRVDPLRRQTRLPRAEIIDALASHFRRRYGLTRDTVTGGELRAARDLARAKFASRAWTARVP